MLTIRFVNRKWDKDLGEPTWLKLIWAANKIDPTMFGKPNLDNPYVEDYGKTKVVFEGRGLGPVAVVAEGDAAIDVLDKAFDALGGWDAEGVIERKVYVR